VATGLVVAVLVAVAAPFHRAIAVTAGLAVPSLHGALATGVERRAVEIPLDGGALEGDLYAPARPRGALLLVHGLSALGRRQPDLARLAELLAGQGQLVLVPHLPGLAAFELTGREVAEIRASLAALRRMRPAGGGLPLALAGFSFGAGPALLAAAGEDDLRLVGSFGGHADLANVVAFVTTGSHGVDGRRHTAAPEAYNRWKLLRLLVPLVGDGGDGPLLRTVAERRLANPADDTSAVEADMGAEGRAVMALVTNRRADAVPALLARLPARAREALAALSPLPAMARIRGTVLIAHGEADPSIPYTESLRLAAAAGPGARLALFETFHHTGPGGLAALLPAARDAWRLFRVADALVD
jgi:dienelactone hydrolase